MKHCKHIHKTGGFYQCHKTHNMAKTQKDLLDLCPNNPLNHRYESLEKVEQEYELLKEKKQLGSLKL